MAEYWDTSPYTISFAVHTPEPQLELRAGFPTVLSFHTHKQNVYSHFNKLQEQRRTALKEHELWSEHA